MNVMERTLHIRAVYYRGGRKSRSARKRLLAMGLEPGHARNGFRVLRRPYRILPGIPYGLVKETLHAPQ